MYYKKLKNRYLLYIVFSILIISTLFPGTAFTHEKTVNGIIDPKKIASITQNAIGRKIGNFTFIDQDGKPFALKELRGRPFIVSFIYTSCPQTCGLITASLIDSVRKAGEKLGDDITVLTIGFDPERDTPLRMKGYGMRFTDDFEHFKFLSADRRTIGEITSVFGFYYRRLENGIFEHANMVSLVDSKGRIYDHIFGVTLKAPDILSALKGMKAPPDGLSIRKKTSITDSLKLFCSRYNPATGTYDFYYPYFIVMVTQIITIISVFLFVWWEEVTSLFARVKGAFCYKV